MRFSDNDQRDRTLDSDRIGQASEFNLPARLVQAVGLFTALRFIGYIAIIHPAFLPLLWFPAAISTVIAGVTVIRIKDNLRQGFSAVGQLEANALLLVVLLALAPVVGYQLESRLEVKSDASTVQTTRQ